MQNPKRTPIPAVVRFIKHSLSGCAHNSHAWEGRLPAFFSFCCFEPFPRMITSPKSGSENTSKVNLLLPRSLGSTHLEAQSLSFSSPRPWKGLKKLKQPAQLNRLSQWKTRWSLMSRTPTPVTIRLLIWRGNLTNRSVSKRVVAVTPPPA